MRQRIAGQGAKLVVVLAVVVGSALLVSPAAEAGERGERWRGHGHRYAPLPQLPAPHLRGLRPMMPPARIFVGERPGWGRYERGRVYYEPHRHMHQLYYFPVATPRGVVMTPHYYCGGRLFSVGVTAPHVHLEIGF